ncbi:MAG: flagellar hook-length control protein FliK, partial [Planctomycetota bacterium]|nr:flagellar hook-length control protein FliK [Planctomycetota bacterium]
PSEDEPRPAAPARSTTVRPAPAQAETIPQTTRATSGTHQAIDAEVQAVREKSSHKGREVQADRTEARPATMHVSADRSAASPAPAVARAGQVDAAVQLENIAGQLSGGTGEGITARGARVAVAPGAALKADGVGAGAPGLFNAEPDGESEFAGRIVRGLSTMVSQRGGVMNMRLHPPELGSLRVQMSIIQGTVTAQFTATTEHAHVMLERSLTVLQNALHNHGLNVEKLGVQLASADPSASSARHDTNQNSQQHQQQGSDHDAAGGESRGRDGDGQRGFRHRRADPGAFAFSFADTGAGEASFTRAAFTGEESS